jgi:DNA (cytosine-5)-methyltransferase 1
MIKALELFSGIGAFAEAAGKTDVNVIAAFDQDPRANATYELNHGLKPSARNLDTITSKELPSADLWWMSPPCQPYSVRGNQKGLNDPRSRSFVNLMGHLKDHRPSVFMLENVAGFLDSDAHRMAAENLRSLGYEIHVIERSPTDFGVPMRRPRIYLVATTDGVTFTAGNEKTTKTILLEDFVNDSFTEELIVSKQDFDKYGRSLHIVKPGQDEAYATCFTSGYWKSFKSSGTFIELENEVIRRFSPEEIVALMGFSATFAFPDHLSLQAKLQLAGNTVDVRAIEYMLNGLSSFD